MAVGEGKREGRPAAAVALGHMASWAGSEREGRGRPGLGQAQAGAMGEKRGGGAVWLGRAGLATGEKGEGRGWLGWAASGNRLNGTKGKIGKKKRFSIYSEEDFGSLTT